MSGGLRSMLGSVVRPAYKVDDTHPNFIGTQGGVEGTRACVGLQDRQARNLLS